ncbi:MAG: hypothetical protein IPJ88_15225 [Myxococcales bacterium]|nr:MAG: hypothetical protein IPJ88_15225 [Myxococcales bacterium]
MSIEGILQLSSAVNDQERRNLWRQSMASLGAAALNQRLVPLEGFSPESVQAFVRSALEHNLIDDLEWLSAPAAAVALYELAAAVPVGTERHQLGRRVAFRLHESDASTFVALATSLAMGSRHGLNTEAAQTRVALALDLPLGNDAQVDALALALISKKELERQWLSIPSMGSLPSRRLAARLLERAARQAAMKASQGDIVALSAFESHEVKSAWQRLLWDRESLVWSHVAAARGLLSSSVSSLQNDIDRGLRPTAGIGDLRKSAASLAASLAVRPKQSLERCTSLLESNLLKKDPGISAAMVLGIPRSVEVEPEAAERLLEKIVEKADAYTAEAMIELRQQIGGADFGAKAFSSMQQKLRAELETLPSDDPAKRRFTIVSLRNLAPSNGHFQPAFTTI